MSGKFQEAGKTSNQVKQDRNTVSASNEPMDPAELTPEQIEAEARAKEMAAWLSMARDAYRVSEDYFDASVRKNIERNIAHFNGRHAPGSKYYSELYKYRARGFRPKTRSVIRRNEAKAAIALFSTSDAVAVGAENDNNIDQVISAEVNQQILNYRLDNTIPWFQIAMGGYQDALTTGVVVSHQYWDYEEAEEEEILVGEDGQSVLDNETGKEATGIRRYVVRDTPRIELRPVENVRFSPGADWEDPINTSPYLIDKIPMTIEQIKSRAQQSHKTRVKWLSLDDKNLRAGGTVEDYDPVRAQREGHRQDSKDQNHSTSDFDTVWVFRVIIRMKGVDWLFYTLGDHSMLSEPVPLTTEYPHLKPGQRPYVLGTAMVESHKTYPESLAGISATLQQEANDINNQRRDNVQLVLNRRYFVRRGAEINYRQLTRNIPGSAVEMSDPSKDIKVEAPPDVTGSSYQEQDRINMDFDELTGTFSTSSVGSNRQLNETVGGMELLSGDADDVTEYQLRTYVQTWVKPVLKQVVQLIQRFETDPGILQMAGQKAELWQKYGANTITDRMLQGNMTIQINVGFGATNPKQRVEKLVMGVNAVVNLSPRMGMRLDGDEVAREIFGSLGYDGADRFFPPEDPNNPIQQPSDPRIEAQKIMAEVKAQEIQSRERMKMAELNMKADEADKERQFQGLLETYRQELDKIMKMSDEGMNTENNKVRLAEIVMKLRSMEKQKAATGQSQQLTAPPYEPPGRAPAGQAYAR